MRLKVTIGYTIVVSALFLIALKFENAPSSNQQESSGLVIDPSSPSGITQLFEKPQSSTTSSMNDSVSFLAIKTSIE